MRTLDEVIKAWSICFSDNSRSDCTGCPYADEDGDAACFNHDREDALHYLKEFQGLSKMWNDKLDKDQDNSALTWEQLKQMEGKPVYIVEDYGRNHWEIVDGVHDEDVSFGYFSLDKDVFGTEWKAYRKER